MRKRFWIYMITNELTNKKYIGQTNDFCKRISAHRRGTYKNTYIGRSIKKYGWDAHKVDILFYEENVPLKVGDSIEEYYMRYYNTLYPYGKMGLNIKNGGNSSSPTKESIRKNSEKRFLNYAEKIGKKDVPIQVFTKKGELILESCESPRTILEKLNVPENNIGKKVLHLNTHLKKGWLTFMGKYIIQWKGENRVELYNEEVKSRIKRLHSYDKNISAALEKNKRKVINNLNGVIYNSIKDLAINLNTPTKTVWHRLNKSNFYKDKYTFI